jgi:acetylserotonin N-methyltransferase
MTVAASTDHALSLDPPIQPDTPIWDVWLSAYRMPALAMADEIGLFEALEADPMGAEALGARIGADPEALKALLPMLAALGMLSVRLGLYRPTSPARTYLLKDSPYYWGHAFTAHRQGALVEGLRRALKGRQAEVQAQSRPGDAWEAGQVSSDMARMVAAFMNSHSMPAAAGVARYGDFAGVTRLLDVGGGSGCFAITLAQADPKLRCTVMELPTMCEVALRYIAQGGVSDRIDTTSVDMFREAWPKGYDAIFFSNIFHDWSLETNAGLSRSAFEALPSGGRIYLHEMLIADDGSGPLAPASFSLMMLIGTRGRQFRFAELKGLLEGAGFVEVEARDTYGHYSLVSAKKP